MRDQRPLARIVRPQAEPRRLEMAECTPHALGAVIRALPQRVAQERAEVGEMGVVHAPLHLPEQGDCHFGSLFAAIFGS